MVDNLSTNIELCPYDQVLKVDRPYSRRGSTCRRRYTGRRWRSPSRTPARHHPAALTGDVNTSSSCRRCCTSGTRCPGSGRPRGNSPTTTTARALPERLRDRVDAHPRATTHGSLGDPQARRPATSQTTAGRSSASSTRSTCSLRVCSALACGGGDSRGPR